MQLNHLFYLNRIISWKNYFLKLFKFEFEVRFLKRKKIIKNRVRQNPSQNEKIFLIIQNLYIPFLI